jgi:hypothetical protein
LERFEFEESERDAGLRLMKTVAIADGVLSDKDLARHGASSRRGPQRVRRRAERMTGERAKIGVAALFAAVASLVIAKALATFAVIVRPYLAIDYGVWFELGMVVGQVLFQWAVMWRRPWNDKLRYAGVLVFVSTVGAVLLGPLLFLNHFAPVRVLTAVGYFFAVVGIMFVLHWRIVIRLRLPTSLCVTWVLYRLLILLVVLKRPW